MGTGAQSQMVRHLTIDEQGTGLRATWRPEHGFVNLSLWRDDQCVETFHLAPCEAADLMSFLAHALAEAATPPLRVAAPTDRPARAPRPPAQARVSRALRGLRTLVPRRRA